MAETKQFEYSVRNQDGKIVRNKIEASSEAAVANRLKSMGLAPLSITEVSTSGLQKEINIPGFGPKVKLKDLAVMTRQLATMVSAGLTLLRALSILAEQTENEALRKTLGYVRTDVENGQSLSTALAKHPVDFPPLMVNMIRAGETGGFLEKSLLSIANNYETEVALRQKVKSAMTYPVMVFIMAIVAVFGMLIFIVPVFEEMFAELDSELPAPTQMLVHLSGILKVIIVPLIIGFIVFMVWWRKNKHTEKVRRVVDPWKLKLPIFGNLNRKIAISRFSRNFGTMLGAGVPILQALDIVGATSGNIVVQDAITEVKESVRQGESLSGPLRKHQVFPPMVVQMMAVGEDSGAMEQMLGKVSDFYDQEVESTTEQLTSLIEPLMIAVLGVMIGGMIVALYLPIFSVMDQI